MKLPTRNDTKMNRSMDENSATLSAAVDAASRDNAATTNGRKWLIPIRLSRSSQNFSVSVNGLSLGKKL
jgi:hypothetical protein